MRLFHIYSVDLAVDDNTLTVLMVSCPVEYDTPTNAITTTNKTTGDIVTTSQTTDPITTAAQTTDAIVQTVQTTDAITMSTGNTDAGVTTPGSLTNESATVHDVTGIKFR